MHLFVQIQSVSKESNNEPTSIPYLGHFLTDLMMIDAAYSGKRQNLTLKYDLGEEIFLHQKLCIFYTKIFAFFAPTLEI